MSETTYVKAMTMKTMYSSYIRMFNGKPEELNSDANFLTDSIELRSNSMASTLAVGISLSIASLTSFAAFIFLTPKITWTPRKARMRAVSAPIPLDAPVLPCPTATKIHNQGVTYHRKTLTHSKNYLSQPNCNSSR